MRNSRWLRLLASATGLVDQKVLLRNEYLAAENRILGAKLPARLRRSNPERTTLAEIGRRLERKVLREVACAANPDTILEDWWPGKFDGSKHQQYPLKPLENFTELKSR
jgi:putative transposase